MLLDWKHKQWGRAGVKNTIRKLLDQLPDAFTPELYELKCDLVYKYVYNLQAQRVMAY